MRSTDTASSSTCPTEPLDAAADRDKLRQILANLVDNAVKFSPDGGIVTVAARRKAAAVEVRVVDRGPGIPPAERARIFRKFYRGDVARDHAGSTGLGLFIAEGLVRAMGGRIWVDSEEGQGSSFAFELPLAGEPAEVIGLEARAVNDDAATRVLVIDDEAPIRLLCRVNLEAEGMKVFEAGDGPTGLEQARSSRPDVILLDVMMPGLDGWAVAEELIDDDATADIPIVFLTARAELRDRARGLELGGIDYVTKPFNPVELASLVRNLLARVNAGERADLRSEKIAELRELARRVTVIRAASRQAILAEIARCDLCVCQTATLYDV